MSNSTSDDHILSFILSDDLEQLQMELSDLVYQVLGIAHRTRKMQEECQRLYQHASWEEFMSSRFPTFPDDDEDTEENQETE